jgi:hypothetical protein
MHALHASATANLADTHSCLPTLWSLVLCAHQIELDVIECFTLCEVVVIWDCQQTRLVATNNRLCRTQHVGKNLASCQLVVVDCRSCCLLQLHDHVRSCSCILQHMLCCWDTRPPQRPA